MKSLILIGLMLLAAPAFAQEEEISGDDQQLEHRIVTLLHVKPEHIFHLFAGRLRVTPSNALDVVMLTGTPEQLDAAEQEIRKLDLTALARRAEHKERVDSTDKEMELHVHYIGVGVEGRAIPADSRLVSVVEQLERSFDYADYSLIVSDMVRVAQWDDDVRIAGSMPNVVADPEGTVPPNKSSYQLELNFRGFIEKEGVRVAVVRNLEVEWSVAVPARNEWGFEVTQAAISSHVNLPEGKLVVLGKAGLPGRDQGIFVVLEARPVD